MSRHTYNLDGGDDLTTMGASWFVSYAYWLHIDKTARNWEKVSTHNSRVSVFKRSKEHHDSWIREVLHMKDDNLNKNRIGLDAAEIKRMARKLMDEIYRQ
jgi:hypothetical protein